MWRYPDVFDFNPQEPLNNSISCLLPQLVDANRQLTGHMFNLTANLMAFPRAKWPRRKQPVGTTQHGNMLPINTVEKKQ